MHLCRDEQKGTMKHLFLCSDSLISRYFTSQRFLSLIAGTLAVLLPGQMAFGARKDKATNLAYVTVRDATPNAGAVAIIDTKKNEVIATVPVGPGPNGMAVSSDEKRGYVVNYGPFAGPLGQATSLNDTVSVLKLVPKNRDKEMKPRVVDTVTVGKGPLGIAITPDDKEVYVTNFGQDATLVPGSVEGNTVSVINTSNNRVVATVLVGNLPAGIAIRPDGRRAYVTCRRTNEVWIIDTTSHSVVGTIPVQSAPANVVFTPNGQRAYVTNFGSNSVSVIDTARQTAIPVPDGAAIRVGLVPIGITISPNGKRAYVASAFSNSVSVIDTTTNTVVETLDVAAGPRAVAITPDGDHVYVTNFLDNTIFAIETKKNTIADVIPINGGPNWVTIVR